MSEYQITTTYGKFVYPKHFKYPEGSEIYFLQHESNWKQLLETTKNNENKVAIEIGVLHGGCSVWLLENYLNKVNDTLYCIDINEDSYLKNNLEPYKNVKLKLGLSSDVLLNMIHENKSPVADLIYIDGSHIAKHVMEDALLSWKLLKEGGIMIFDDYGWGTQEKIQNQPKTGVDAFLHGYQKNYDILSAGWQIAIRKKSEEMPAEILTANYAVKNEFFNKEKF